ncbi:hypothetical protein G9A89_023375 [Geosiphon pyriformis]|nr:hypothetical protein G9A89_023375 [Geosiphon pyriformis]
MTVDQIFTQSSLTPLTKLLRNLSPDIISIKTPVVLLTTGSINPIHKQHINIFELAKRTIHPQTPLNEKYIVVGGYISPSQDLYVNSKLGALAIPAIHRIAMAKLATRDSDWVDVDEWEARTEEMKGMFIDFHRVAHRLQQWLNECQEVQEARSVAMATGGVLSPIKVMYLCGFDHVLRTGTPD